MGQTADWMNSNDRQENTDTDDFTTTSYGGNPDDTAYTYGITGANAESYLDSTDTTGMDAMSTDVASEGDQVEGAEEIRAEIEQTRSDMAETINAIQEKLSPQHLVDQAKDSIKEATVGRVEQMISNVGDKVGEMAGQAQDTVGDTAGGILETIKKNPLPAAVAGAGLAWLFMKGNNGSSSSHPIPQAHIYPTAPQYPYPAYQGSEQRPSNQGGGIMETIKQNPIPLGLAGLGLWALMGGKGGSSSGNRNQYSGYQQTQVNRPYGTPGGSQQLPSLGDTLSKAGEKIGDVAGGAGDKVGQVAGKVGDVAGNVGSTVADVAGNVGGAVVDVAGNVGGTVGDVAGNVGSAVGTVAGQVGSTAGSAAGAVGGLAGDLLELAKRNPMQTALAGLSISWLLMNGRDGSRGGDKIIQNVQSALGDAAGGAGSKVGEIAGGAQNQFQQTLMENPLVVGAAAMALGAAVGLAVPETTHEHKLMGPARDTLVEKVQGVAQDTMQKVQHVAEEVGNTVQSEVQSQGLMSNPA